MECLEKIRLKDGRECILRNGMESDGKAALDIFILRRWTSFTGL